MAKTISLPPEAIEEHAAVIRRYRTLARAVMAQDAPACREMHQMLIDYDRPLSEEGIFAMSMKWLENRKGDDVPDRDMDVASFLSDIGFDFNRKIFLKDVDTPKPLPHCLCDDKDDHETLLALVARNLVDVNVPDVSGMPLIAKALQGGHFDLAEKLLEKGASLETKNMIGQSPLHLLAAEGAFRAVDWLLRHGADPVVEDTLGHRPAELVPEDEQATDWDMEALYDALEDAAEAKMDGLPPPEQRSESFKAMMEKEQKEDNPEPSDTSQTLDTTAAPRVPTP